jgi:ribosome-associated toxin RatA of RatAB toxin-antitoxin module
MAQAEFHEVLNVDKDKLYAVVTRYEDYPKFVEGCTQVEVQRKGPGHARVTYHVSMMKDIVYTLDLREDPTTGVVEWSLAESDTFKKNSGRWELKAAGPGKTDVKYAVEVDFKIMVPGFILNRLVKGSLPSMVAGFEKRAKM